MTSLKGSLTSAERMTGTLPATRHSLSLVWTAEVTVSAETGAGRIRQNVAFLSPASLESSEPQSVRSPVTSALTP